MAEAASSPAPNAVPSAPSVPAAASAAWTPFEEGLRQHFPSREALLAEARAQTRRRRPARKVAGTALVAALLAGLWWADPAWRSETVQTAVGEQGRWTLGDGSSIALNTHSSLRVESRIRSRRFVLDQGEAAFQVVHNWRPFSVQAGSTKVLDIGTTFTVKRNPTGAEVTVQQGAVEVFEASGQVRTLRAGQAVQAVETGAAHPLREVDAAAVGAWQQGRIVFDGTPLAEALAELQRHRAAPIVLGDSRAGQLRLSGAYDLRSLEALLDTLPQALPVTVVRAPDGSVRISSRETSRQKKL